MSIGMNIPKCANCGETYGVAIGVPAWITFDENGKAQIGFDISEISDIDRDDILCRCDFDDRADLQEGDYGDITDRLDEVIEAWRTSKLSTDVEYQITGYGRCGACGLQHENTSGACDLEGAE